MKYKVFFCLILVSGVLLRLCHAWKAPYAYVNSDTATLWIMARNIVHGELPLFFYGQYYLGPMEALAIALFFILFGIKASTLYLGTILYSGLFLISSYFLGKELKDRLTGLLVMLYCAFPPAYFFWESISPLGYHIEILLLGNIIFILTLKIPNLPQGGKKICYYIFLGACAGTGIWTHYIILYYLLPSAVYLFFNEKLKVLIKNSIPALISLFISALPFWAFTFKYNFATFRFKSQQTAESAFLKFLKLLISQLNYMFNVGYAFSSFCLIDILKFAMFCVYLVLILYFILKSLSKSFVKKPTSIFTYFLLSLSLFYISYKSKIAVGEGYNYILPIITFVSIVFGCAISNLFNKRRIFLGIFISAFVLLFNMNSIFVLMQEKEEHSIFQEQVTRDKIKFHQTKGILRYVAHEGYSRPIVFFSDEKIVATGYLESRYPRHEYIVEASERVGFERPDNNLEPMLKNMCAHYDFEREIFYNFEPFGYRTEALNPFNWHAYADTNMFDAKNAFDRNYDKYWVSRVNKRTGLNFVVDIGKAYEICKIVILNKFAYAGYPCGVKIETSLNEKDWKESGFIKDIQPLFWSGPRPYWRLDDGRLEWFIKPTKARFIKFIQIGEDKKNPWIINEILIYRYIGKEKWKIRDYIKDIKEVISFLHKNNIKFVYADFWPSAKIIELSNNKIQALLPYNTFLPLRKDIYRDIKLDKGRAFLVANENTGMFESIAREFDLPFRSIRFRKYICFYFGDLPGKYRSINSLFWAEIGMIKYRLKEYSDWLYKQGDYGKALKYYPNNYLAYLKLRNLPKTKYYPEIENPISFVDGVKFLGCSIRSKKIQPGKVIRIEYFWQIKNELKSDLSVFVYFIKDNKIVFQNDHAFLFQFAKPLSPLKEERFREVLKLKIPENIEKGSYQIVIGLWDEIKKKRIKIKDSKGERASKFTVGELVVEQKPAVF